MRHLLAKLFVLGFVALFAFAAWLAWFAYTPIPLAASPTDFSIRRGSTLRGATRQIIESGVGVRAWPFNFIGRWLFDSTKIKAGSYEVEAGVTPWQLMEKITQGDFTQAEIVFIEGWTFRQVRAALDASPTVTHVTAGLTDTEVMRRLGSQGAAPEGMFFPDTYLFGKGESDLAILARAYRAMQKRLQSTWQSRDPDTPLATPYEALILASIVEKETGQSTERKLIAGVFTNRLRLGMRLQTDPSVIYGIGESFDGNLRKRDLVADTPFNTYTRIGLPPHPIAMPGQASLTAAVNPARTDALYFVSRGDGTSLFSRSLDEHNRAVEKYQKSPRAADR